MTIFNSVDNSIQIERSNTVIGLGAGNITHAGSAIQNVFLGFTAGHSYTSATNCVFVGYVSGYTTTTALNCTGVGSFSLSVNQIGRDSTAVGYASLNLCTASNNTAIGSLSGGFLAGGNNNLMCGYAAGNNYTSNESSNILLGPNVLGTVGESNTIRIGEYGSSTAQQNKTYIAACYSNRGTLNTFMGESGNTSFTILTAFQNTFAGSGTGNALTVGVNNCFYGDSIGAGFDSGNHNSIFGSSCFGFASGAIGNCGFGASTLKLTDGNYNIALGYESLNGLLNGNNNVAIGYLSGGNYNTTESNNILISNAGSFGESATIRIGTAGTHNDCFIAGVTGNIVAGPSVTVDASGQIGQTISSRRYKKNIKPMSSEDINKVLNLNPVEFEYISEKCKGKQFGLIAEEVHEVIPELVFYKDGIPDSVNYLSIPALLIDIIKNQEIRIKQLELKFSA